MVELCFDKVTGRLFQKRTPTSLILKQPFCTAYEGSYSRSLDAFQVFNREALLCSLFELPTHKSTKEQLKKGLIRNVPL